MKYSVKALLEENERLRRQLVRLEKIAASRSADIDLMEPVYQTFVDAVNWKAVAIGYATKLLKGNRPKALEHTDLEFSQLSRSPQLAELKARTNIEITRDMRAKLGEIIRDIDTLASRLHNDPTETVADLIDLAERASKLRPLTDINPGELKHDISESYMERDRG